MDDGAQQVAEEGEGERSEGSASGDQDSGVATATEAKSPEEVGLYPIPYTLHPAP